MINQYEKEKLEMRERMNKLTLDYENMIKKYNQEKIELINKYESLVNQ